MEREEGEDMLFLFSFFFWSGGWVVGENISSLPVCVRDVNRRRVESSRACLSGCLVGKSKASPSKLKTKDKARYSFHLTTDMTISHPNQPSKPIAAPPFSKDNKLMLFDDTEPMVT